MIVIGLVDFTRLEGMDKFRSALARYRSIWCTAVLPWTTIRKKMTTMQGPQGYPGLRLASNLLPIDDIDGWKDAVEILVAPRIKRIINRIVAR
jgi:hypothetical protein